MSPLVLMPLLLAQTHANWEASVRTEVRARTATAQDQGTNAAGDVELRPFLSGSLFNGPWSVNGSYSPTFRSREPYSTNRMGAPIGDHSHVVQLGGVWAKEGTARVFAGEFFNYGTLDLSTLNREGAVAGQPAPPPPVRTGLGLVQELTTDTSVGLDWYLTQRLTLTLTGGFVYGGGTDEVSRRSLPLQSSYRVGSKLAWLASRLDTFALNASGQYVRFFQVPAYNDGMREVAANPGARVVILELSTRYDRLLAEETTVDVTVGITGVVGQIPNTDPNVPGAFKTINNPGGLVAAGFSHREQLKGQQVDFRLNASLAPFVDRFAGSVYQRVEAGGTIGWSNAQRFSASLSAGVARSLPVGNELALTSVYGEGGGGYQGDPWWRVDVVGRLSVNRQDNLPVAAGMTVGPPPPLGTQWVVGLSLTLIAASQQPRTFQAEEKRGP